MEMDVLRVRVHVRGGVGGVAGGVPSGAIGIVTIGDDRDVGDGSIGSIDSDRVWLRAQDDLQ